MPLMVAESKLGCQRHLPSGTQHFDPHRVERHSVYGEKT